MAIAFVNAANATASGSDNHIHAAAADHTSGNLIVVLVGNETSGNPAVTGVADTAGNTYTQVTSQTRGAETAELWYAKNITGNASNAVTATFASNATYRSIIVFQFSGIDATAPLEGVGKDYDSSANLSSAHTVDTTTADSVIVAGWQTAASTTFTVGAGFTIPTNGWVAYCMAEYKIVSTLTHCDATATASASGNWSGVSASFKAAAGGGGGSIIPILMNDYRRRRM